MTSRKYFEVDMSDFVDLAREFRYCADNVDDIINSEIGEFGMNVLADAKALAPSDSGDLEDSLEMTTTVKNSGAYEFAIGSNLKYATRRHEEPYSKGYRNKYEKGVKYPKYYLNGRGEKTRQKPNVGKYKPGRKYLSNAFMYNQKNIPKLEKNIMSRIFKGGSSS